MLPQYMALCVSLFRPKKNCVSVRWVTLWVRPPLCPLSVRSIGNIVGASPPRVCPLIGRQSLLDRCMLPTPLFGIFSIRKASVWSIIFLIKLENTYRITLVQQICPTNT